MSVVYTGEFSSIADVISQFEAPTDALDNAVVFYADYDQGDYDGEATVIFEKDGKLWEVVGSHCSCYGLEGQWEPEETNWEAIALRPWLAELAKSHIQRQTCGR